MKKMNVKKIARLSLFLALGIVLNIIESMIPIPIAIPGIRLGLANTIGLIVLFFYSPLEFALMGFLRVFLVGLLRTGLMSPAFMFSLSGWLISTILVIILNKISKASIFGLSIISAMFHQVGQIVVAIIIYNQLAFINYLPVLLFTGIISGILVAFISKQVLIRLDKAIK